ncbi:MAG: VOC family protein [Chitinophagaceae bacterium]
MNACSNEVKQTESVGDSLKQDPLTGQQILHATFEAKEVRFMASDSGKDEAEANIGGMVHLTLDVDNAEELERVFNALSEGGKVTMPLQDAFWGARFGMLTDKFGVNWMFNHELQKN